MRRIARASHYVDRDIFPADTLDEIFFRQDADGDIQLITVLRIRSAAGDQQNPNEQDQG